MARPKGLEETFPLHTRLTGSQLAGFREYLRRQQAQIRHTGVQLTDAAVLRGMVLRALELENIPHSGVQPELLATTPSLPPVVPVAPTAPSSVTGMTKTEIPEPPPSLPSEPPPSSEPPPPPLPVAIEPKKGITEKAAPKAKPAPKVKTARSLQPAPKVTKSATKPTSKANTKGPTKKATNKGGP